MKEMSLKVFYLFLTQNLTLARLARKMHTDLSKKVFLQKDISSITAQYLDQNLSFSSLIILYLTTCAYD